MKDLEVIDAIQEVRSKNNVNWMDILRLALKHAPEETKNLIKRINKSDNEISELLGKLK